MSAAGLQPRTVAADIVRRTAFDGAFASAALHAELEKSPQLDGRDRRFITELTYGTLRAWGYLGQRLGALAPRGLSGVDPQTSAHLYVAAYQIVFLPRVPDRAAVHGAVEAVKTSRNVRLGAFVNGILRHLARQIATEPAPPLEQATLAGTPPWLLAALDRALGPGQGAAFVSAGPVPPPLGLHVRRVEETDAWVERLREEVPDILVTRGAVAPGALLVHRAGDPRRLPGVATGALLVQEEGAQAVALALGAQPGERILDACAGHGNKTIVLADAVGSTGRVDAADLHPNKLARLRERSAVAGVTIGTCFPVDWSVGRGDVPAGVYDRVLVDAPCSGVGTLRRRPELLIRRREADLPELAALQRSILRQAAEAVRPGGTLLYAVCSVLREETEAIVAHLPEFTLTSIRRLTPHEQGTDGYAMATLIRSHGAIL